MEQITSSMSKITHDATSTSLSNNSNRLSCDHNKYINSKPHISPEHSEELMQKTINPLTPINVSHKNKTDIIGENSGLFVNEKTGPDKNSPNNQQTVTSAETVRVVIYQPSRLVNQSTTVSPQLKNVKHSIINHSTAGL